MGQTLPEHQARALNDALKAGFSKEDLSRPAQCIARFIMEAWGDADAPAHARNGVSAGDVVISGLLFAHGGAQTRTPEDLASGIDALADVVATTGSDVMARIAVLLEIYSRYADRSPAPIFLEPYRALLRDTAYDLRTASNALTSGKVLTDAQRTALQARATWLAHELPWL